jgi:hypothetical protein
MILAKDIEAGMILRGYDIATKQYQEIKVTSCFKIQNIRWRLQFLGTDHIFISPDTFLLTTNGFWCTKDLADYTAFKLIKKDMTIHHGSNTVTPKVHMKIMESPDFFYDIRTESELPVLVDGFLVYFKCSETNKYGFQKESDSDQPITQSLDEKQRTIRVPEES